MVAGIIVSAAADEKVLSDPATWVGHPRFIGQARPGGWQDYRSQ